MSIQDDAQAAVEAAEKVREDIATTPPTSSLPAVEFVEIHYVDGTVTHLLPEGTGEPGPEQETQPTPPSGEESVMTPGTQSEG